MKRFGVTYLALPGFLVRANCLHKAFLAGNLWSAMSFVQCMQLLWAIKVVIILEPGSVRAA